MVAPAGVAAMHGEPTLFCKLQAAREAAKSPAKINKVRSCTLSQVPIPSTSDRHRDCKPTLAPAHPDCPSRSYYIHFKGNGEYLDDFIVQIDAPLLDSISITLFNQLIFDTPQLCCYLGCTERFNVAHRADVVFFGYRVQVSLFRQNGTDYHKMLELGISCVMLD